MHACVDGTNANASMSACKPHIDMTTPHHADMQNLGRAFFIVAFFVHDDDEDGRFRKIGVERILF